jgi:flagellar basal-body rod protein FlgG
MLKALNTAATGMQAQQTNMEVISNNMANVGTTGFKKARAEFEDLMYQTIKEPGQASGANSVSPTGVQTGLGVRTASVQKDFSYGSSIVTKNPLDLQIEGPGFFQIQTADGQVAFTRDGSFKRDPQGKLIDKNGNSLLPEITIPGNASGIEIASNGEVRIITSENQNPQQVGQIDIVNFVNPAGLKAIGKNLFMLSPASGQPISTRPGLQGTGFIAQGQLEGSNVNIADEMVNMITAQRFYETNSKTIQAADEMLKAVNSLR